MWTFFLYSLVFAQGNSAEVDCSKNAFDECEAPEMVRFVPREISTFHSLCPQLPAFLRCLKGFQDQCGSKGARIFDSDEIYNGMYSAFSDLCEKGTELNTVTTANLRCLNDTFRTTSCPEKVKAVTGRFRTPLESTEDEDDYTLPIEIMCLQDILESDCVAADIGRNCGQVALEATLGFLRETHYIQDTCGEQNSKYLLKTLDLYDLDLEQKELVIATLERVVLSDRD